MQEMKRGEVWYTDLDGDTVGSEQTGFRPAVILSNDIGNAFAPTVIIVPMTSQPRKEQITHVALTADFLPCDSIVLTEQIRVISKQRIFEYVGRLTDEQLQAVEQATAHSLNFILQRKGEADHECN